jgi:hypothetical protein
LDWFGAGKTCGEANCTMGCCPSGFGMNGVAEVNASAPTVWDNSIM